KKTVKQRKRSQKTLQPEATTEDLEQTWQIVSEELRASVFQLSEILSEGSVPFDAAADTPVHEQRTEALIRIQDCLISRSGPEALSLLRAARSVWPEGDTFGSVEVGPEEELALLKRILFTNLPRPVDSALEDDGIDLEEEDELESVTVSESEFSFLDFIKRFANPNVVRPYFILLRSYSQNSAPTNHCIIRMLHRLAVDLNMEALFYQLSVFCVFNKILEDPAAEVYQELVTFAKFVLKRFFTFAAKNSKAFVEMLFWKNVGVVREMTEDYSKDGEGCKKKVKWTTEEDQELGDLYEKHNDSGVPDIVETLIPLLSSTRTRREVVSQMVVLGLVDSVKDLKKERFSDLSTDVLGNILKHITAKRSRARVVDKILSMGLVSDRRDLYKKRKRNAPEKSTGMTEEEFFGLTGESQELDLDQDEEEDNSEEELDSEEHIGVSSSKEQKSRSEGILERNPNLRSIAQALRQQGLSGPVLWLQNSLNRTADDREEDGVSHPLPLVPLTEENEDAMENRAFQKLLRKVGIRAPADGQESFWRIPDSLSVYHLRSLAVSLDPFEETSADGHTDADSTNCLAAEIEDNMDNKELRAQALRALLLSRKRKNSSAPSEDWTSCEGSVETEEHGDRLMVMSSKKRSRVLDSDDDDDDDDKKDEDSVSKMNSESDVESDSKTHAAPAKRRYRRVLSDY
ncbi:protein timeless-like protein, partial [Triplophysa rosa]